MKQLAILLLICSYTTILCQEKHALIIAIGDYPEISGWLDISSENDISYLDNALKTSGFKKENIHYLINDYATKYDINQKLDAFAESILKEGDIFFFSFSGHGQQMIDIDGDEIDGYDEAIVPYDSSQEYFEGENEGEYLITDDQIFKMFSKIRKRLGQEGHMLCLFDACHSGSATRAYGKYRGTTIKMAPKDYTPEVKTGTESFFEKSDNTGQAKMFSFFASRANEVNKEIVDQNQKTVGPLSFCFNEALLRLEGEITYERLFKEIKVLMNKRINSQTPVFQGEKSTVYLKNHRNKKVEHFNVIGFNKSKKNKSHKIKEGDIIEINAGLVNEFFEGSTLSFIAPQNKNKKLTGEIVSNSFNTSEVKITSGSDTEDRLLRYEVYMDKKALPFSVTYSLDFINAEHEKNISTALSEYHYLTKSSSNPELMISEYEDKDEKGLYYIEICDQHGDYFQSYSIDPYGDYVESSVSDLKNLLKYKSIKALELENSTMKMAFKIIQDGKAVEKRTFQTGEKFIIKLINTSELDLYFALLDLTPDKNVKVVLPFSTVERFTPENCFIQSKGSLELPIVANDENGLGTDHIKLVSSTEPLDLESIQNTRGQSNSDTDSQNDFQNFFQFVFGNDKTRSISPAIDISTVHIENLLIEVKE